MAFANACFKDVKAERAASLQSRVDEGLVLSQFVEMMKKAGSVGDKPMIEIYETKVLFQSSGQHGAGKVADGANFLKEENRSPMG